MKRLIILIKLFLIPAALLAQPTVNNTTFHVIVDGKENTSSVVSWNPNDVHDLNRPGFLMLYFNDTISTVDSIVTNGVLDGLDLQDYYVYPDLGTGIFMLRINYATFHEGGDVFVYCTRLEYRAECFKQFDTTAAYNHGVASVDTMLYYVHGVLSVDTMRYFNMGIAAVDTLIPYNNGFRAGLAAQGGDNKSDTAILFSARDTAKAFYNGQSSVNTDEFYNNGYKDGVAAANSTTGVGSTSFDIGLSVYPNPVVKGESVTVSCFNYDHVDIYNMTGAKVMSSTETTIPTDDLPSGLYVFTVWDSSNNVNTTKVLVK